MALPGRGGRVLSATPAVLCVVDRPQWMRKGDAHVQALVAGDPQARVRYADAGRAFAGQRVLRLQPQVASFISQNRYQPWDGVEEWMLLDESERAAFTTADTAEASADAATTVTYAGDGVSVDLLAYSLLGGEPEVSVMRWLGLSVTERMAVREEVRGFAAARDVAAMILAGREEMTLYDLVSMTRAELREAADASAGGAASELCGTARAWGAEFTVTSTAAALYAERMRCALLYMLTAQRETTGMLSHGAVITRWLGMDPAMRRAAINAATPRERDLSLLLLPYLLSASKLAMGAQAGVLRQLSSLLPLDKQAALVSGLDGVREAVATAAVAHAAVAEEEDTATPGSATTAFHARVENTKGMTLARVWAYALCAYHSNLEDAFAELQKVDEGGLKTTEMDEYFALVKTAAYREQYDLVVRCDAVFRGIALDDAARVLWHLAHLRETGVCYVDAAAQRAPPTHGRDVVLRKGLALGTEGREDAAAPPLPAALAMEKHFPFERFRAGLPSVSRAHAERMWAGLAAKEKAGFAAEARQEGVPSAAAYLFNYGVTPPSWRMPAGFQAFAAEEVAGEYGSTADADADTDVGGIPPNRVRELAAAWLQLSPVHRRPYVERETAAIEDPHAPVAAPAGLCAAWLEIHHTLPGFSTSHDAFGAPGRAYHNGSTADWPLMTDGEKFACNALAGMDAFRESMAAHTEAVLRVYFAGRYLSAGDAATRVSREIPVDVDGGISYVSTKSTPTRRNSGARGVAAAYTAWRSTGTSGLVYPLALLPSPLAPTAAAAAAGVDVLAAAGVVEPVAAHAAGWRGVADEATAPPSRALWVGAARRVGGGGGGAGGRTPASPALCSVYIKRELAAAKVALLEEAGVVTAALPSDIRGYLARVPRDAALAAIARAVRAGKLAAARGEHLASAPLTPALTPDDFMLSAHLTEDDIDAVLAGALQLSWNPAEIAAVRQENDDRDGAIEDDDGAAAAASDANEGALTADADLTPAGIAAHTAAVDWRPRTTVEARGEIARLFNVDVAADRLWEVLAEVLVGDLSEATHPGRVPAAASVDDLPTPQGARPAAMRAILSADAEAPTETEAAPDAHAWTTWREHTPRAVQAAVLASLNAAWVVDGGRGPAQQRLEACRIAHSTAVREGETPGERHFLAQMHGGAHAAAPLALTLAKGLWEDMPRGERVVYELAVRDAERRVLAEALDVDHVRGDSVHATLRDLARERVVTREEGRSSAAGGAASDTREALKFWVRAGGVEREWALAELRYERFNVFTAAVAVGVARLAGAALLTGQEVYDTLVDESFNGLVARLRFFPKREVNAFLALDKAALATALRLADELNAAQARAHVEALAPLKPANLKTTALRRLCLPITHYLIARGGSATDVEREHLRAYAALPPAERAPYVLEARKYGSLLAATDRAVTPTACDVFESETLCGPSDWKTLAEHRQEYYERQAALLAARRLTAEDFAGPTTAFGVFLSTALCARLSASEAEQYFYTVGARQTDMLRPYDAEAARNAAWLHAHKHSVGGLRLAALEAAAVQDAVAAVTPAAFLAAQDGVAVKNTALAEELWMLAGPETRDEMLIAKWGAAGVAAHLASTRDVPASLALPEDDEAWGDLPAAAQRERVRAFADALAQQTIMRNGVQYEHLPPLTDVAAVLAEELCIAPERALEVFNHDFGEGFWEYLRQKKFSRDRLRQAMVRSAAGDATGDASEADRIIDEERARYILEADIPDATKVQILLEQLESAAENGLEGLYNTVLPRVAALAAKAVTARDQNRRQLAFIDEGEATPGGISAMEERALSKFFMRVPMNHALQRELQQYWRPLTDATALPLFEHARLCTAPAAYDMYRVIEAEMSNSSATAEENLRRKWDALPSDARMPYIMFTNASRVDFKNSRDYRRVLAHGQHNTVSILRQVRRFLTKFYSNERNDIERAMFGEDDVKKSKAAKEDIVVRAFSRTCDNLAALPQAEATSREAILKALLDFKNTVRGAVQASMA